MAFSCPTRTQIFLCYNTQDQLLKEELMEQLAYCQRRWSLDIWENERILAGQEIKAEIASALTVAKVAVLLVSASFLASEWITAYEVPTLLKAAEKEGLRLLPVLLSPCFYQVSELRDLQYINPLARSKSQTASWAPLSRMSKHKRSEVWVKVVEAIQQELGEMNQSYQVHEGFVHMNLSSTQGDEDQTFFDAYQSAVRNDPLLSKIQVLDMDHALALEDMYVRVQIHRERRFRSSVEFTEQRAYDPLSVFHGQQKKGEDLTRTGMEPMVALATFPHCVVVGDPGAGKTTFLKYLALQCVSGQFERIAKCAVFVSLHDFARNIRVYNNLVDYILAEWERIYHLPRVQAAHFLDRGMRAGRILVLLDALDETMIGDEIIQAERMYQTIHGAVEDLHRSYPTTPLVVTARKAAYHQHAHLVDFDVLEVVDFSSAQIEAFVKNWFQHHPQEERRTMGEGLLLRLKKNPRIATFAANPLLLGLMAYTYEENNERLPANRADLYKLCIETLLRKWDDKRKIRRMHAAIDTYEQERLLPRLAWHFHSQGLRYFTQRELMTCIHEFAEATGRSTREEQVATILAEITSDNGLLREQAPGYYGFLHLTLQEYFTARHLANIQGLELLLSHFGHPWWEEVILLYAGQVDDASNLLEKLLPPALPGEVREDLFCNKLLLAGRCLAAQVQIIQNKHLRTKIADLLLEKLTCPLTLLRQQVADVLAEIGRTYPEQDINDRLFVLVKEKTIDEELRLVLLNAICSAGSRQLQWRLLPLLWEVDALSQKPLLSWFARHKIIPLLEPFVEKKALLAEAKSKLVQQNVPEQVLESIIALLCRYADSATLGWLLEWLEQEEKMNLLVRAFSILNVHRKRTDGAIAFPSIIRFLKKPFSSGYRPNVGLLGQSPLTEENKLFLEEVVQNHACCLEKREAVLEVLTTIKGQEIDELLYRMLTDPDEEETLRQATVHRVFWKGQPAYQSKLVEMLSWKQISVALRLAIATEFLKKDPQKAIPVLWDLYDTQKANPITRENLYFSLQPLLLLLERDQTKALLSMRELLESVDNKEVYGVFQDPNEEMQIYLLVSNQHYYSAFSRRMARKVIDLADNTILGDFCFNQRIHPLIRRDIIRQLVQTGKQIDSYAPTFLAELKDRTQSGDTRATLAETVGELPMDEQTMASLVTLYQEEMTLEVKDPLYTALYKVARRLNVTIVPSEEDENVLRVIKR